MTNNTLKFYFLFNISIIYIFYVSINIKKYRKRIDCGNIAHGCGIIDSTKYTNSLEAFYNSYSKGFRKIEIDLSVTRDNHIFGSHDLDLFKEITNYKFNDIINYTYITKSKILEKYHIICDFEIFDLLNKFEDVIIVTDKITNYILLKHYSKYVDRLYVEVPTYFHYFKSKQHGMTNILLSIKTNKDLIGVLKFLSKGNTLFGIVIGSKLFYSNKTQLKKIFNLNTNIYVTGIKDKLSMKLAFCKYVSGFYID